MNNSKFLNATLGFLLVLIVISNFIFIPVNILSWDVFGYYLYLPFTFIYNDLGLNNDAVIKAIIEQYHNTATFYQASQIEGGGYVMKYSMGLAVLYAPFFFIGHLLAPILGYAQDGFSLPYQYAIFGGGILYSMTGLWVLAKVLRQLFSDGIASIALILVVLSTNYIVHISMYGQNAMSHNHLFLAYALILWLTIQWHKTHKPTMLLFLGLVCGLSILSRPSEIVCLLIPFLWGVTDKNTFREKIKLLVVHKKQLLLFALLIIAIGFPQLIYWKMYYGKWLFNSYGANAGEGFEFLHPYLYEVLFSFRKGWLIYTPIMVFGIIGFYFTHKYNRSLFAAIFLYFACNFYIVASWSCWWYAQSFSQRALIPSYPIMAIALGYFLTWLQNRKLVMNVLLGTIMVSLSLLNIFQTIQYYKGVLHGDRMTRDYYMATFGKLQATDADRQLLLINRSFDGTETFQDSSLYTMKYTERLDFNIPGASENYVMIGDSSAFRLDSLTIYSPAIERAYKLITDEDHAWVRVSADVYITEDAARNPFCAVTHLTHKGYAYKYKTFESVDMKLALNQWNKISFDYLTPEVRRPSDPLKVYFWLMGSRPVYIDNLQVAIYTPHKLHS